MFLVSNRRGNSSRDGKCVVELYGGLSRRRQFREECKLCKMEGLGSGSDLSWNISAKHMARNIFPGNGHKIEKTVFDPYLELIIIVFDICEKIRNRSEFHRSTIDRGKSNRFSNRFSETFHGHFTYNYTLDISFDLSTPDLILRQKKKKPRIRRNFFFNANEIQSKSNRLHVC